MSHSSTTDLQLRYAKLADLNALTELEAQCFASDRLSLRSFRRYVQADHSVLLVAEQANSFDTNTEILGYGLIWCHRGTRLARLYSLAVAPKAQGRKIGQHLLEQLEAEACERGKLYMRLEVAEQNPAAIKLYQRLGYRVFGEYENYYDDHSDALRMQKQIRRAKQNSLLRQTPWYSQTTDFTCGPAALMMAMASLSTDLICEQSLELNIWREATTIFMTSGHGGCHPFGLALAAHRRGFESYVWVNSDQPLFIDGVRSEQKKAIMTAVHEQFSHQCDESGIERVYADISSEQVESWFNSGFAVLVLISTYRLDGKKAPHWVVITGVDQHCFYLHDPDVVSTDHGAIDRQYVPIAREDFALMCSFGASRLKTAIALSALLS